MSKIEIIKINQLVPIGDAPAIDPSLIVGINFNTWYDGPSYKVGDYFIELTNGSAVCSGDTECHGRVVVYKVTAPFERGNTLLIEHKQLIGEYTINAAIITQ